MTKPFRPHLATDAVVDKLEFPVKVQFKVDGVRMLVRDNKATGRSMKPYKNIKLTEYFSQECFNGFDMELATTELNDPDLCRLTTSQVNTIKGDLPNIAFVFDYITHETEHLGYEDRMVELDKYIQETYLPAEVEIITSSSYQINSKEQLMEFYENALSQNFEGLILRKGKYKNGRATIKEADYLRMKPTGDSEGIVLRVEDTYENQNEAKVNELGYTERSTHQDNKVAKGQVGSLWLEDIYSGKEVKVGVGKMTHEQRKYYFENQDEIVGQLVKYKFLGTGQKDLPRHPRYVSHRSWEDMSV